MTPTEYAKAVDAIYAAGYSLYTRDRAGDAIDIFRTMLVAAPTDERSWLGLGACHETLGEHEKALKLYRMARYATGAKPRVELAVARASRVLGERDEMENAYERARDLAFASDEEELLRTIDSEWGMT